MHTCCTTNTPLFGVLEWISLQGGTFNAFTPGLITGKVRGLTYRYFITEGWIGLKAPGCPAGKAIECLTVEDFQCALEIHAPNAKAETSARSDDSSPAPCSLPTCDEADKGGCWWEGKQVRERHEWYMTGTNGAVCRQCGVRAVLEANASRERCAIAHTLDGIVGNSGGDE
jgi:hypothetical protein